MQQFILSKRPTFIGEVVTSIRTSYWSPRIILSDKTLICHPFSGFGYEHHEAFGTKQCLILMSI